MNDLFNDMQNDHLEPDPNFTEQVVRRWVIERASRRRMHRLLTTLTPFAAAAVLVFGVFLTRHLLEQRQPPAATGPALAALMREVSVAGAFEPARLEQAIDRTAALFDPSEALALLIPEGALDPEHTPGHSLKEPAP